MGAKHVIIRKIDGTEILRRVEQHGVTVMCGAPAVANAILDAAATWEGPIPGNGTTRMVIAGAPPPTRTIERIETELGWEFIQIYGLTETTPLLTMNRKRVELDALSPGGQGGQAQPCRVRRRSASRCASRPTARCSPAATTSWPATGTSPRRPPTRSDPPTTTRDGPTWFHTGDGGRIDDDSYVTISDRKKDVIISGGENVSSIEVEDAIFSHPEVAEVAVIGVPDEKWGEMVMALVVTTDGSSLIGATT